MTKTLAYHAQESLLTFSALLTSASSDGVLAALLLHCLYHYNRQPHNIRLQKHDSETPQP
jgi:hypothetical protein